MKPFYAIGFVCLTILCIYLLNVLWEYRQVIAAAMLLFLFTTGGLWIAVTARAKLVEQVLRLERVHYKEEMPLEVYQQRSLTYSDYFVEDEEA